MEAIMEKCAILVRKSSKRHLSDGMELLNQDKIRKGARGIETMLTYQYNDLKTTHKNVEKD